MDSNKDDILNAKDLSFDFDEPGTADLESEEELSDELCNLYPTAVAVYYEECIRAMQQLMKSL